MKLFHKTHSKNSVANGQDGFTIVELMIALAIFTTILIICTVVMIEIGIIYAKGVNQASLQNTTRSVVSDVAAAIQFNGSQPFSCTPQTSPRPTCYVDSTPNELFPDSTTDTVYVYCVGTTRYSYVLDRELGIDSFNGHNTPHVLWRDTMQDANTCVPLDINLPTTPSDTHTVNPPDGYEMMGDHMRLTGFNVTPSGNAFAIAVNTAFGDSDLLTASSSVPGQDNCNGGSGQQFCATSQITTYATQRVQ